jgi:hypothetical protein
MDSARLLEYVSLFRVSFADRPLWMFLALLAVLSVLPAPRARWASLARTIALLALIGYVGVMIWYVSKEAYYDFAEPTMACVAWLFDRGRPIYHAFDAPERYSHMYGPLAFMIPGWFLSLAGPSIAASKAVGALAGLFGLAVIYRLARTATATSTTTATAMTDRGQALILTGLFALVCLMYRNLSFWVRPDSFALLFTSLALLAATWRQRWAAALGVGVCAGVLLNLKLTGPLYALPAIGLLFARFGIASVLLAGVASIAAGAAPFVFFSNVSFTNYVTWVRMSAKNGLLFTVLHQNIEWAMFLLLPLAPTLLVPEPRLDSERPVRWWLYAGLGVGLAGVVVAASKPGAGSYHLMPFWPVIIYAIALHADALRARFQADAALRRCTIAFAGVAILIAALQQIYFIGMTKSTDGLALEADLQRFAAEHAGRSFAMGYSHLGERWTFARAVLVFRSGIYPIDAPAVQEYGMSGLAVPEATIAAVRRCDVNLWLIPKGAKPFEGPNKYPTTNYGPLFPESFIRAFAESYAHTGDTQYFEIWSCRHGVTR